MSINYDMGTPYLHFVSLVYTSITLHRLSEPDARDRWK